MTTTERTAMSDTTTTPPKPVWIRCKGSGKGESNGCRQRVFNDRIDIELHKQHCPADLERVVKLLTDRVDKLEKAEPEQIDLEDVSDDWPDSDEDSVDGPDERPAPVPAAAHVNAASTSDDEDDDYFDNEPTAPPLGGSLYTPGTGPL